MKTLRVNRRGFTLLELLTLLALVAVGMALLSSALARARPTSEAARCLNNLRRLMGAVTMYTQDYQELFPPNPDDGNTIPGYNWCEGEAGIGQGYEFDPDILADPAGCLMAPYIGTNPSLFHCTADLRTGLYDGPNPAKAGTVVLAARTVSMSGAVGTIDPMFAANGGGHAGKPTLPVNGPWLTGSHQNRHNNPWRTYGKTSDIVAPLPAGLFVLLEESPFSINDACFGFSAAVPEWLDYPSDLHNGGGVFGFADGHVELHKWVVRSTRIVALPESVVPVATNDEDWVWLASRTSVLAK